jgi:hypothetical protein
VSSDTYWTRFNKLINGLIERTPTSKSGEGGLKWERVSDYTYDLNLTRSTLRIKSKDEDGAPPYTFSILDDKGQPTETIEDDGNDEYGSWNLSTLYHIASRSHSGSEEKLTEVLRELGLEEEPDPWGTAPNRDDEPPF